MSESTYQRITRRYCSRLSQQQVGVVTTPQNLSDAERSLLLTMADEFDRLREETAERELERPDGKRERDGR